MSIILYTPKEIQKMHAPAKIASDTLSYLKKFVKVGITTSEINLIAHDYIKSHDATPAPLKEGFPAAICTSVNDEICHGIPDDRTLQDGDILNIDVSLYKDGFCGDVSKMFLIGNVSDDAKKLVTTTYECLVRSLLILRPGISLFDIAKRIQTHANNNNYSVVRDFCGHGLGKTLHEEPQILHYVIKGSDGSWQKKTKLKEGMVFAIEPMINAGGYELFIHDNNWTALTKDSSLSAQYEHMVAITKKGAKILTLDEDEKNNPLFKRFIV